MKNKKMLALVLVIAVMLMGAGYAAWTQALTVSTSVSTASFDVDLACISSQSNSDYASALCRDSDENKTIDIIITEMHPKGSILFQYSVNNNGSIPVAYDSLQIIEEKEGQSDATPYENLEEFQQAISDRKLIVEFSDGKDFANMGTIAAGQRKIVEMRVAMDDTDDLNLQNKTDILKFKVVPKFVQKVQ